MPAAKRDSARPPRIHPLRPSSAAAPRGHCTRPMKRESIMPDTFTCNRSTDESTLRTVWPPEASSPSTCHGSSACRNSRRMPRLVTEPINGKSKLEVRREPFLLKCESRFAQIRDHIFPIELDEIRQHEAVVQRSSPPHEFAAVWSLPEMRDQRAHQQLLRQTHARVRRHLECPQFHQTQPRFGGVGRIELIDAEFGAMRVAGYVGKKMPEHPIALPWQDTLRNLCPKSDRTQFPVRKSHPCALHPRADAGW